MQAACDIGVDGHFCPSVKCRSSCRAPFSFLDLSMVHSIVVDRFGNDVQKKIVIFCGKISGKIF